MNYRFIALLLLLSSFTASESELKITITGIDAAHQGKTMFIGLWKAENPKFPDDQHPDIGLKGVISAQTFTVRRSLPPGQYAVSVYVDLNGNAALDNNVFGDPKEPFGVSNNVIPKFSAPSMAECKFELSEPTSISIQLQ
jgi:uncharacterized protein (DUF2141 family)